MNKDGYFVLAQNQRAVLKADVCLSVTLGQRALRNAFEETLNLYLNGWQDKKELQVRIGK